MAGRPREYLPILLPPDFPSIFPPPLELARGVHAIFQHVEHVEAESQLGMSMKGPAVDEDSVCSETVEEGLQLVGERSFAFAITELDRESGGREPSQSKEETAV